MALMLAFPGSSVAELPASQPTSRPAAAGPRFRCDQATHDFGTVWDGDKIEHEFVIHNDGNAPLEILAVQPTCGCTLARQYDKTIVPGGQGRIEATLDTAGRSGEVVKQINVTTNDPANGRTVLTFTGKVRQRISIEPVGGLLFGQYAPGMQLTRTVRATNNTTAAMKLQAVPASQPSVFGVEVRDVESGKVAELTVTARPPLVEGLNSAPVKLKTGIPEQAELTIPCRLFVPPVVEITPSFLMVRPPLTQEMRRTVLLRYNGEETMKITSVHAEPATITTQLVEQTPGKAFNIAVTLPAGLDVYPSKPGSIVLATNLKDKPTITIEIRPASPLTSTKPAAK
jgi:hypothetical protein